MPEIYITALVTTGLAVGIIGYVLWQLARPAERPFLLFALLLELPMSLLAFQCVRTPLIDWVISHHYRWHAWLLLVYAPLTEEPAKLVPLLVPSFRATLTRGNALKRALAAGLGFGIGEAWVIAYWTARVPAYAHLHWYQFGGFLNERFLVCILHGLMTAAALRFYPRFFPLGVLLAMTIHFFGNFPIFLAAWDWGHLGKPVWQAILAYYLPVYLLVVTALILLLYGIGFGQFWKTMSGRAKCPECGHVYYRPLLGLNLLDLRYEPCEGCGRWHWTTSLKETPPA